MQQQRLAQAQCNQALLSQVHNTKDCLPNRQERAPQVGFQLPPVDPPSDGVSGIGRPHQHHGGTPVVLKQGPVLAQESGVRALQDCPLAFRPQGPYEELPKETHQPVALVVLQHKASRVRLCS